MFTYLDAFDDEPEAVAELKDHYRRGGLGDVVLKKRLQTKLERVIAPIRERRHLFGGKKDYLMDVIRAGTAKANAVTRETLEEVKTALKIFRLDRDLSLT